MAWVQVANRKINTALITYMEETGESVAVWFSGSPVPLQLHFDEAKAFWRHLRAEDTQAGKSHGFATLQKTTGGDVFDIKSDQEGVVEKQPKAPPAPAAVRPGQPPQPGIKPVVAELKRHA